MAARLTRAKKTIVAAGIPFAIPGLDALPDRLDTLAQTAYLAFTAGYAPSSGPDPVRLDLAGEAIRLVRVLLAAPGNRCSSRFSPAHRNPRGLRRDARPRQGRIKFAYPAINCTSSQT
jgi:hypothetical protein